jgi:toxin YhaV
MVVNGWTLFAHPLFTQQIERLHSRVSALAAKEPSTYEQQPAAKLLATIRKYILEIIPRDPNAAGFRQGNTLGRDNRHWFRAKFHERYRLFYRFSSRHKVIIYAWVNDENSLRKVGAKTDPYTIFREMLTAGNLPNDMHQLMSTSKQIPEGDKTAAPSQRNRKTRRKPGE